MMKTKVVLNRLLIASFVMLISGCSTYEVAQDYVLEYFDSKDNREPPAELVNFRASLKVTKLWETNVGEGTKEMYLKLTPIVTYDKIFAASADGKVSAYDTTTGKLVWETKTDTQISGGPGSGDNLVFVGTSDAEVLALEQDTGKLKWRARVSSEVLAPPRADSGVVVARTIDGKLVGLSTENGTKLWTHDRPVPVLSLRGTSAPVIYDDVLIVGFASGKLAAISLQEGKTLWETRIAIPSGRSELDRMVDIDADPIVGDGVIHVVTFQGNIATVLLKTGQVVWQRDMSSHSGIAMDERYLFVSDDESHIWALDRESSSALWKQDKLHARAITAPAVYGEYVVVGDLEGYLHWINSDDGSFAARIRVDESPIIAPPVVVDDILYVTTEQGTLAAYQANGS